MKSVLFIILLTSTLPGMMPRLNQRGPHQGTVKPLDDKYQLEVLGCMDHLELYVLDKKLQSTSNFEMNGTVTFYYAGASEKPKQKTLTVPLVAYGRDGFSAKLPEENFSYSIVTLTIFDKTLVSPQFPNECSKISVTK
jgi:hypothetical protein